MFHKNIDEIIINYHEFVFIILIIFYDHKHLKY